MNCNYPYKEILDWHDQPMPSEITLSDHLGGHRHDMTNSVLDKLNQIAGLLGKKLSVRYHSILTTQVSEHYPNLNIIFDYELQHRFNLKSLELYTKHPEIDFKNFLCSFNGTAHVGRKLLVSILNRMGMFDSQYCSKNFSYSSNKLDGHICEFAKDRDRFYRKFFISTDTDDFFQKIYSFGHVQYDHANNIYNLENKITQSFIHVVSETMATSYYPFVTEKFLYSIVTRGLFVAYAQPGWHDHVEKYYGFKKYAQLFDYAFDSIQNPIERLVQLVSMISKFKTLNPYDWHDLYLLEQDTVEYNYNHYFSGAYLRQLQKYGQ